MSAAKSKITILAAILMAIVDVPDGRLALAIRNYVRSIRWDLNHRCRHQNHDSIRIGSSLYVELRAETDWLPLFSYNIGFSMTCPIIYLVADIVLAHAHTEKCITIII